MDWSFDTRGPGAAYRAGAVRLDPLRRAKVDHDELWHLPGAAPDGRTGAVTGARRRAADRAGRSGSPQRPRDRPPAAATGPSGGHWRVALAVAGGAASSR